MAIIDTKPCCWCGSDLTNSKIYRPTTKAHRRTKEDLVFCNHAEYSAYVKAERGSRELSGGFDCPANA